MKTGSAPSAKNIKVKYCLVEAGLHYARKSAKPVSGHYIMRTGVALMKVVEKRALNRWPCIPIEKARYTAYCATDGTKGRALIRAIYDGLYLGSLAERSRRQIFREP